MNSNPPSIMRNPKLLFNAQARRLNRPNGLPSGNIYLFPSPVPRAFTLVELLVVITIIGILIALLLPAVQAAREAARQLQCKNHLKQLALGCLQHEEATGRFPTGGWGYSWTGDADRGTDWRQPGGWIYNILPYIEQQAMHDMGCGLEGPADVADSDKCKAHLQRMATPLSILYCPSRRSAIVYPWNLDGNAAFKKPLVNAGMPTVVGRSDYAANGGDSITTTGRPITPFWTPWANNDSGPASITEVENPPGQMTPNARATFASVASVATGVVYGGSLINLADVTDGTSNTYLIGEKYIITDHYAVGLSTSDNEGAMIGDNGDISRWTYLPPYPDTPGYDPAYNFGSAHAVGFHMALCDGSVHMINYTITADVHRFLGNRMDGQVIDAKEY